MDLLIKNTNLISMAGSPEMEKGTNIYIDKGRIVHIGELKKELNPGKIIDGNNKIAMPGLVNAHTHIGMSLLRNYADDVPLHQWLTKKIWPIEAKLTGEDVYWASLLSMVEMIESGTTTFNDMYFFMDEVGRGIEESGMRGVLTRGIIEEEGLEEEKLEDTRRLYKAWQGKGNGRIKVVVGPHAPYTCGPAYLKEIISLAKELGTSIHIHLAETKKELEDSLELYGKSPVKHVYDLGLFEVPTVAAHCVYVDEEDIRIMAENRVSPVHNPSSNLKLASGFAPINKMLGYGVNVALGTDGSASNNNLNMFEELHLTTLVHKAVNLDALVIPAITALEMATIRGARALAWDRDIGSIDLGKKADIILIDIDRPHLYPHHNMISAMAYSVQGSDVDTVIIDGKLVMENREIKTLDVEKIIYKTNKLAKDLINR